MTGPEAGICRACGALAQYLNGTWVTVRLNDTCRYGARAHSDITSDPKAATQISLGRSRVPAGTYSVA